MAAVAERYETLSAAFEELRRLPSFAKGAAAPAVREAAFARFLANGFPNTRDEEWRHTNIAPIAAHSFGRRPAEQPGHQVGYGLDVGRAFFVDDAAACQFVVVNGSPKASVANVPAGVTIGRAVAPELAAGANAIVDLNTAFADAALTIDVAPGAIVAGTIHVVFVSISFDAPWIWAPRLVVNVGAHAQASIVESHVTLGTTATFTDVVAQIRVGADAILHHAKLVRDQPTPVALADYHLASTFVQVERGGTFASTAITLGGRIVRNDIVATLAGEGAECTLNGLYVADGDALVDTHTTIDHAKAHCPSHELYKGILAGQARAVFNGKIIVRQDAQKTDAKQTNKALLLTDQASINTKPQLEIFADDVKCTHGAAIGQLDEDAMFYLRARGVSQLDARNMLIHAFAGEVLDGLKSDAVRGMAMQLMEQKLRLTNVPNA